MPFATPLKSVALALLLLLSARAFAQETAVANDQALFLAGLPVRGTALEQASLNPAWVDHATSFDAAWKKIETRQLAPIRKWASEFIPEVAASRDPLFYMFSGPDFLYAQAFFPNAATYVLCGIEPIGSIPDVTALPAEALAPSLQMLRKSLDSVLNFSFFITKDMRMELGANRLSGTLPVLYVFLARSGCHIDSVQMVGLDKSGALVEGKAAVPGVRITFTRPALGVPETATPLRTLYYFSNDLSDGAVEKSKFLPWCASLGEGRAFLKAASYLMHEGGFNTVREFLQAHCRTIIQDESGIPVRFFAPADWTLRLFGTYAGPIDLFKQHVQPQLSELYRGSNAPPLTFGVGYRWRPSESTLILAEKK